MSVQGVRSDFAQTADFTQRIVLLNDGGTVTLPSTLSSESYNPAGLSVSVEADNSNDALVIKVTGDSNTWHWKATANISENG